MKIPSLHAGGGNELAPKLDALKAADSGKTADTKKVAGEFESIMLRQFLNESMKSLLSNGPSGQVYGYFLTDTLASKMSEAGGLGLSSILQAQLGQGGAK